MKPWLTRSFATIAAVWLASAAFAAECGPDKLGVSRVEKVGTQGGLEVGWKTYHATLPLADHEVILTFDDGPDPTYTPQVLDALAAQCVRATFFAIGAKVDSAPSTLTPTRSRPCATCRPSRRAPTSSRASSP